MKKIAAVILSTVVGATNAQEVDIKGIKIGMTKQEFASAFPAGIQGFTVGGVESKYPQPSVVWSAEGTLDRFMFFFAAKNYEEVKAAVKSKYPRLKCESSPIRTKAGVEYTQEDCLYGVLHLSRFVSDINTGVLSMHNPRLAEEKAKEAEAKKKDI